MIPMFMIPMYILFLSLLLAYVISMIYILQLGGVNCHCLIVQIALKILEMYEDAYSSKDKDKVQKIHWMLGKTSKFTTKTE